MDFTETQLIVIKNLSDGIVPADDISPSASQIGVNFIFVDIAKSWEEESFFGTAAALDAIHHMVNTIFGKNISHLTKEEMAQLIDIISAMDDFNQFWEPFRLLITLSYYALPPAFLPLGMPGPTVDQGGLTVDGFPV